MSNLDRLVEAGLVDPDRLSAEHRDIIDNQLSDLEVDSLVSAQQKFGGTGSMHSGPGIAQFY